MIVYLAVMRLHSSILALAVAALAAGAGCARPLYVQAESMAGAPDGRFWIAGSERFAAYSSGGRLVRADYPRAEGAPDYAYEPYMLPVAHLLAVNGQVFLFTRYGDALLFENGAWRRLPFDLREMMGGEVQIDAVRAAPDGKILIHIHDNKIVWASTDRPLRVGAVVERLPMYFTWVGFIDGELYGLGWEGSRRALERRVGAEQWRSVALPDAYNGDELRGVVRLPSGAIAVIASTGLVVPSERGAPQIIPAPDQPQERRAPALVADPQSLASSFPPRSDWNFLASPAHVAVDPPNGGGPGLKIAGPSEESPPPDAPPTPAQPSGTILRALEMPGRPPILVVFGRGTGLIDMARPEIAFEPCDKASDLMAAAPMPGGGGVRMVARNGSIVEFNESGCHQASPPMIVSEPNIPIY